MISLTRAAAPQQLDGQTVSDLTTEYIQTGSSVWNKKYIRDALLQSSKFKCSYCEATVNEESKYMEVEHYRCKKDFPHLVVSWDNLLPSCKRCNVNKGSYNVETHGVIADPFNYDPKTHFYFQNYRLRGRDDIGRKTIDVVYLNDTDRLVSVRMRIGELIAHALENIRGQLEVYISGERSVKQCNQITRGVEKLLKQAHPSSEFSSLAATVIVGDADYIWIQHELKKLGLWGGLEPLDEMAASVALMP